MSGGGEGAGACCSMCGVSAAPRWRPQPSGRSWGRLIGLVKTLSWPICPSGVRLSRFGAAGGFEAAPGGPSLAVRWSLVTLGPARPLVTRLGRRHGRPHAHFRRGASVGKVRDVVEIVSPVSEIVVTCACAIILVDAGERCRAQKNARGNDSGDPHFLARRLYDYNLYNPVRTSNHIRESQSVHPRSPTRGHAIRHRDRRRRARCMTL